MSKVLVDGAQVASCKASVYSRADIRGTRGSGLILEGFMKAVRRAQVLCRLLWWGTAATCMMLSSPYALAQPERDVCVVAKQTQSLRDAPILTQDGNIVGTYNSKTKFYLILPKVTVLRWEGGTEDWAYLQPIVDDTELRGWAPLDVSLYEPTECPPGRRRPQRKQ